MTTPKPHSITLSTSFKNVNRNDVANNNLFNEINYPFLTLRLPSKQIHTDSEIMAKILVPFLKNFTTETETIQYLFRKDVEANGNIYFSVMYDAKLDNDGLYEKWTQCTENLGYMSRAEKRNEAIAEHEKNLIV